VTSLNKLLSIAAPLPLFSAAHGHMYTSPLNNAPRSNQTGLSQQSKENTPMPETQSTRTIQPTKSTLSTNSTGFEDTQMFLDALNLSRRYGKEYMDDAPLVGEPGNFRTSKTREAPAMGKETSPNQRQSPVPAKEKSQVPSPPPPIQTDVPQVTSRKSAKGGERSPTTPGGREKPKRRKSRPAVTPTES
jgi:mediator of RNA polymerase II transcription subunit 6